MKKVWQSCRLIDNKANVPNIGLRNRGKIGIYKWLHSIGKSKEHKISAHIVSRLNLLDTSRTFLSSVNAYHTKITLFTSRHSNNTLNGRATCAIGCPPGGAQNLSVDERI